MWVEHSLYMLILIELEDYRIFVASVIRILLWLHEQVI